MTPLSASSTTTTTATTTTTTDDLMQIDRAFRREEWTLETPPTRWYINLTERCPLRCQHCITLAPEKTAARTARIMSEEILDALVPFLSHAMYVGFVHAGEPMSAPLFFPLLRKIQDARSGAPTICHLLTNGLGLHLERFAKLVEHGINSLSFSVDGLTPATHDALRLGSKIDQLLAVIAAIAAYKHQSAPHVRLGIAWTVTRENLHELDGLLDFAATHRLDWIKLEETYPINDRARALADIPPALLQETLQRLTQRADTSRIPLLDHTRSLHTYKCLLSQDPVMRRWSVFDDWINRMEINPCRLPWELICIEPNGDVKPIHFHGPPAGNILQQPLMEIWNGLAFQEFRKQSIQQRICTRGQSSCPADPGPGRW